MKVIAILQARVSSSRLPKKVLRPLLGKPMLAQQIARLQRCNNFHQLVVATSNHIEDQPIIDLCQQLSIECYAGNLTDVLDRFYQTAIHYQADIIVRLTGDCPLTDADIIDNVIAQHLTEQNDYTCNFDPETFPDGFDVEVFNIEQLIEAKQQAKKPSELEHVTPYIRHKCGIKKGNYTSNIDYSRYRLTVDELRDFTLIEKIYNALGQQGQYFSSEQIYKLLNEQPSLASINQNIIRNEGYLTSLEQDQQETSPYD